MSEGKSFESGPEQHVEPVSEKTKEEFIQHAIELTRKSPEPENPSDGQIQIYRLGSKKIEIIYCSEPLDIPKFDPSDTGLFRRIALEIDAVALVKMWEPLPNEEELITTYRVRKHGETEFKSQVINRKESDELKKDFLGKSFEEFRKEHPDFFEGMERKLKNQAAAHDIGFTIATDTQFQEINRVLQEIIEEEHKKEKGV